MIEGKKNRAVLVGVQLPDTSESEQEASLAELGRLVKTMGLEVVAVINQKRASFHPGTIVGEGKLTEIANLTKESEEGEPPVADVVVFDCEISPNQFQNIEDATGVEVLDRTGVIVEIFSRHARTREARLQVEIAQLNYQAPRMRVARAGSGRSGAGVGGRGVGESALELDKRRIRDRVSELRQQIAVIASEQQTRRTRRAEEQTVALVGYTNAGKSSLMRALTDSEVYVADKLFATLDTTMRALHPPQVPKILVSDTVGFIKKLPHDLVASFRSTLEEARDASLLLYVVDASDATFRAQLEVTKQVLSEIGVDDVVSLLVLNKCDRLDASQKEALRAEYPDAVMISTKISEDVARMRKIIIDHFDKTRRTEIYHLKHEQGGLIGKFRTFAKVVRENYTDEGVEVEVIVDDASAGKIASLIGKKK
jgi:GTP-binding protein HflX